MIKIKKEVVLRQVALYMAFLFLTLPFISSQAFALSITKATVVGSAGIENVMRAENDYFTATVSVSEAVDPSQLYISYSKYEAFDECTGKTCTYTSSRTDRAGQEMDYTIQLINSSTVVGSVVGTMLIDEQEPEITDYTVEKNGDDIIISYSVEDTACDECDSCAGIDYLQLYSDDELINEINVASQCEIDDELETSAADLNLADGDHELCLIAVDNTGYLSNTKCEAISIDQEGPHFETGSLIITDAATGLPVKYIGNDYLLVDISINVSDAHLSENTIRADLHALNGVIGNEYANVTADSCFQDSNINTLWTCSWNSYYIEGASGSLTLSFWGYDNEGNDGKYKPTYTLTLDNSVPSVYAVYTDGTESSTAGDDVYFISGSNTLYVDLDPTGSAFAYDGVYLTFSKANIKNEKANDCWNQGSYWTCVWNFSMKSSTTSTSLEIDATDDAGNSMETYDLRVIIDDKEPKITGISTSLACPTAADTLEVVVTATDDVSEKLYLYFYGEEIRTDNEPIIEECDEVDSGGFSCYLIVDDFVSYPADEDVVIEVHDLAGNVADNDIKIEVCELEETETPDFVELDVGNVAPVDLLTLSYLDVPVYVSLDFRMPAYSHVVAKSASCDATSNVYFIDQDSDSSIMVLYLAQNAAVQNTTKEISVDCTMQMTMQYRDKVYSMPETEEFTIEVPVYGTPLGSVDASIQEKINLQIAGIQNAEERINKWVKWNKILGVLCRIADILTKADGVLAGIRAVLTGVAVGIFHAAETPATFVATPMYEGIVAFELFANKYHFFIAKFTWPVGYNKLLSIGSVVKYGCIIYSGRLCEGFYGIENKVLSQGEYGTVEYYRKNIVTPVNSGVLSGTLFADWDPYKSIHTARACMYPDAIIYNLRKERQINCMYTTCIENSATNGLDTYHCEVQFDQRECLYVDGAAWRAMGPNNEILHFFQTSINTFFANLDVFGLSISYTLIPLCKEWENGKTGETYATNPYTNMIADTACHVYAGVVQITETGWFTELLDWDFEAKLEGTDYCAVYGAGDTRTEETI